MKIRISPLWCSGFCKELRFNAILTIIATRHEFGLVTFFNCCVVPLCFCWSLPTGIILSLYLLQIAFTAMLSFWLIYRISNNTKITTHFAICMRHQELLLCDHSVDKLFENGKQKANQHMNIDNSKVDGDYQLCSRSRCTQFCIFLVLESKHLRHKSSTLLFKWQLSEQHYRALTAAIARNAATECNLRANQT